MTPTELQQWLNTHGATLVVDGNPGLVTRQAILDVFTNPCAPAVKDADIEALAVRLCCTPKQVRAVAKVESGGAGFDDHGRPKILFERHVFHQLTEGRWSVAPFSNAKGGGYNEPSWAKLTAAACKDPEAAFAACSWGKFQVLGRHWLGLGYRSAIDLAYSTVTGEAAHYELLARFIEKNHLKEYLAQLSPDPVWCRPFAKAYNGPAYRQFHYDEKLAAEMAR